MESWLDSSSKKKGVNRRQEPLLSSILLQIVDAALVGILFFAPLFFGGRHPLGRFVFILLSGIAGTAWFTRQVLTTPGHWRRTWANFFGLIAILLVTFQLIPLPEQWLKLLAPRNMELLSLWSSNPDQSISMGGWSTLSLTPSSTKIALATLVAYFLLFITVAGRLYALKDIQWLCRTIAMSAIAMSAFGILQYFTSNGLFFWFYQYPYSSTQNAVTGSFSTRNHFAHFVSLGAGLLLAWIVLQVRKTKEKKSESIENLPQKKAAFTSLMLFIGLATIVIAVLLSFSRGGAMALAVVCLATIAIYKFQGLLPGAFFYRLGILGLLTIGVLSISGYEEVTQRLDDFTAGSLEELDNDQGRRKIWSSNLAAIRAGSYFGAGAGSHRDIYPVYFPETSTREYTHAENGYLQVGTENGILGLLLLVCVIATIGTWCWQSLSNARRSAEKILAGALTASLLASAVHAVVDFVWFIPSCMSLTIILSACAFRLSQLTDINTEPADFSASWSRVRWISLSGAIGCLAVWAATAALGPASASLHWDKYLVATIAHKQNVYQQLADEKGVGEQPSHAKQQTELMIHYLRHVLRHDPQAVRARLCLARKYIELFSLQLADSENSMPISQIRESAIDSQFASSRELRAWLLRAFGEKIQLLYRAHYHTKQALKHSPLLGEGYLNLADLCFLEGYGGHAIDAYQNQCLLVRPYDNGDLFRIGYQRFEQLRTDEALEFWKLIYNNHGIHQLKIIRLLAGRLSAKEFITSFKPDWQTLRHVWQNYRRHGNSLDCELIVAYANMAAKKETSHRTLRQAANIWYTLSKMQTELGKHPEATASSRKAVALAPNNYWMRRTLGRNFLQNHQYEEAAIHLRWCLDRHPEDKTLHRELVEATKSRLAQSKTTAVH